MAKAKNSASHPVRLATLATAGLFGSLLLKWWINRWLPPPTSEDYVDAFTGKWKPE